jgi:hypothetical protein
VEQPNRAERVEELNRKVEEGIAKLEELMNRGHSAAFLEALKFWSKLHTYSFGNMLLIFEQFPNASMVAGYRKWESLGFQVRKGERAIRIRGPWLKDVADAETGELVKTLVSYLELRVFDISQTYEFYEGKRPPEPFTPPQGEEDWDEFYDIFCRRLTTLHDIEVKEANLGGGVYGMASARTIRVRRDLPTPQKVAVGLHELFHILARHTEDRQGKDLKTREAEVEIATFVACHLMGCEHPSAADYLMQYKVEPGELKNHLSVVQQLMRDATAMLGIGEERERAPRHDAAVDRGGRRYTRHPVQAVPAHSNGADLHRLRPGDRPAKPGTIPAFRAEAV